MTSRSAAVQDLLAEARGALAFGRAHVVIIADGEISRQLPEMLREKLRGEIDAVIVRLAGQQDTVAETVSAAIRQARLAAPPDAPPRVPRPAAAQGGRLSLLLPDALSIPPASLRELHEIATRLGTHRLVLFVDRDSTLLEDPVRELASRLGAGVSKIELDPSVSLPAEPEPELELELPRFGPAARAGASSPTAIGRIEPVPRAEASATPSGELPRFGRAARASASAPPSAPAATAARPAPARPEAAAAGPRGPAAPVPRSRGTFRLGRWLAIAVLAAGGVVAVPGVVEHVHHEPSPAEVVPAAVPGGEAAAEVTPEGEASEVETEVAAVEPEPETDPAPEPEAAAPEPQVARVPAEAKPAPEPVRTSAARAGSGGAASRSARASRPVARRAAPPPPAPPKPAEVLIAVNFNASPWAELEVDGRKLGPTPIGNLRLSAGTHQVQARFPDGRLVKRSVQVDARNRRFQIR